MRLLLNVIQIIVLIISQNFNGTKIPFEGKWEVAVSEISYPSLYQNVTEGKSNFINGREFPDEKRKIQPMHFEPGVFSSIVDIVVAMNGTFKNV